MISGKSIWKRVRGNNRISQKLKRTTFISFILKPVTSKLIEKHLNAHRIVNSNYETFKFHMFHLLKYSETSIFKIIWREKTKTRSVQETFKNN